MTTPPAEQAAAEGVTEEMVQAGVDTFGGIVGTPENLAKPEYIERMTNSRRKSVTAIYLAMHALEPASPVSDERVRDAERYRWQQYSDYENIPWSNSRNSNPNHFKEWRERYDAAIDIALAESKKDLPT